jgi:hypothetical protein
MSVYLFSDLHGNNLALNRCVNYIKRLSTPQVNGIDFSKNSLLTNPANDPTNKHCICLGDLIDRGPNSLDTVNKYSNLVGNGTAQGKEHWHFIIGNHEHLLLEYLLNKDNESAFNWINNGGETLLKEIYANRENELVINNFLRNFANLMARGFGRIYIRAKHLYIATHAGPVSNREKNLNNLFLEEKLPVPPPRIWARVDGGNIEKHIGNEEREIFNRKRNADNKNLNNNNRKYYVFGHSPISEEVIEHRWNNDDSYNYYGNQKKLLLPLDAGIAKNSKSVAIGYIDKEKRHNVKILDIHPNKYDSTAATDNSIIEEAKTILLTSWEQYWNSLPGQKQNNIKNILMREFAISWKKNWIKDELKHNIWDNATPRRFRKEEYYLTLQPNCLKDPEVRNISSEEFFRPLLNYITIRYNEGKGWSFKSKYQKNAKLNAAKWAFAYLRGTDDLKGGINFYATLNDGRLRQAIRGCPGGNELLNDLSAARVQPRGR